MEPSSRTPEGEPNRCPVCGKELQIEPSRPPGDAPCPHCGTLLWFDPYSSGSTQVHRHLDRTFQQGLEAANDGQYESATNLFGECVLVEPGNLTYVQHFVEALHKKVGNRSKLGPMTKFKERPARFAVQKAIEEQKWGDAIRNGVTVLQVDPWDIITLSAMAVACENIASKGNTPPDSNFAECSAFYRKCAAEAAS